MATNKQVNKSKTTHVRIDRGMAKLLKVYAAKREETMRSVVEGRLADILGVEDG